MFDIIFIGTSGLLNHAKGLRVVGNNLANVNTPGFKSSQLQFANLFERNSSAAAQSDSSGNLAQTGSGLASLGSQVNFRAGLEQGTGNPLDLAINGNGFFAVKRGDTLLYTRSGDFGFNDTGILVNAAGDHVQGLDASGQLADITLGTLGRSPAKATGAVMFAGELSSTIATPPIDVSVAGVTVLDANGVNQPLTLSFHNDGAGTYTVTVKDAANATVSTGVIAFAGGAPLAGKDALTFSYAPAGQAASDVKLDFSALVNLPSSAVPIRVQSQDGYGAGVKTDQTIGSDGVLTAQYSNGQSATGARLALADFVTEAALAEAGGSAFRMVGGATVHYGYAGTDSFGKLAPGRREGSNVDLAEEFGNLILMQRGYQASSHVISTANDMIQQLFDMKGR
jgi:flagellar hook protein FlgE